MLESKSSSTLGEAIPIGVFIFVFEKKVFVLRESAIVAEKQVTGKDSHQNGLPKLLGKKSTIRLKFSVDRRFWYILKVRWLWNRRR